jgi:hypothetical protein
LAEEEPPAVALDETTLRPFTGRYVSDMSIIDISPSGDGGLIMKLSSPPAALESYKAISDEPPEPLPGFTIRMTGDEQYMISDGQYKGMKGNFVRTDGRITGIKLRRPPSRQAVAARPHRTRRASWTPPESGD